MYPAGLVHFLKTHLTCTWESVPRTSHTIRKHFFADIPLRLAKLREHQEDLCSFRIEHRIKTYRPAIEVVNAMHRSGLFSLEGYSALYSGFLAAGLRVTPLAVEDYLAHLQGVIDLAHRQCTFSSLADDHKHELPPYARWAWASLMNATGLCHPSWIGLLGEPDTWLPRVRRGIDPTVFGSEGLQPLVHDPWYLEFARTVDWQHHPQNPLLFIVRTAPRPGHPSSIASGSAARTIAAATHNILKNYARPSTSWCNDFLLRSPGAPSIFKDLCRHSGITLLPTTPFVIHRLPHRQHDRQEEPAAKHSKPTNSNPRATRSSFLQAYFTATPPPAPSHSRATLK